MPFKNLFAIAFGERKNSTSPNIRNDNGNDENHIDVAPYEHTKDAIEEEIRILQEKFGVLSKGMEIQVQLQEMLQIIPRKRQRTDAYNKLVSALKRRGITLTITSRKKKKNHES